MSRQKIFWCLFLALFSTVMVGFSQENEIDGRHEVPAVVLYGKHFLFEEIENFDHASIREYRDSLVQMPGRSDEILSQIDLYLKITSMSKVEVVDLIDSLFDAPEVAYPLINQINYYVATADWDLIGVIEEDTSFYPADKYYGSWNTQIPNPYHAKLYQSDSTKELILRGRGKSDKFVMPVVNVLTSKFGWREGRPHKGIDIDLEVWDTVVTAFPGKVRVARFYSGYGRVVVVRHYNGLETLYAHLHRLSVVPGQEVEAGELVGLGGSSGHSTGSHLHFECRFKGIPINPLSFINYKEQDLNCDTLVFVKSKWGYSTYPKGTTFHNVVAGDNLYEIAKKYGTTTYKLAEINGIRRNSILHVGQKLRVI